MKITQKWLKSNRACIEGREWFQNQSATESVAVLNALVKDEKLEWANWTIVRVMKRKQYLAYAIFAAEQVIDIYEKKYPDDKRPRNAIKAARAVLKKDNKAAGDAAWAAAWAAARAAGDAAWAAAGDAAWAAAWAAAGAAAWAAARAAWAAGDAAQKQMQLKILEYGIELLKEEKI